PSPPWPTISASSPRGTPAPRSSSKASASAASECHSCSSFRSRPAIIAVTRGEGLMHLNALHPTLRRWFSGRFGEPSLPQQMGWPLIREGRHPLIASPTGTGKTLAGFLWAIDSLLQQGSDLSDTTQVLYISPLKALGNDVQKNLQGPLAELKDL